MFRLFFIDYLLLIIVLSLLIIFYSLLIIVYSLLITVYSSFISVYSLLLIQSSSYYEYRKLNEWKRRFYILWPFIQGNCGLGLEAREPLRTQVRFHLAHTLTFFQGGIFRKILKMSSGIEECKIPAWARDFSDRWPWKSMENSWFRKNAGKLQYMSEQKKFPDHIKTIIFPCPDRWLRRFAFSVVKSCVRSGGLVTV